MPLIIPPGHAEFTIGLVCTGDPDLMTVSYGAIIDTSETDQALVDDQALVWDTFVTDNFVDDYAITGVFMKANRLGVITEAENSDVFIGTGAGEPLPPNCAFLVKKKTGLAGRKNRGRFFFPPGLLIEGDVNAAGLLDTVQLAIVQGTLDTLLDDLNAALGTGQVVLLHSDVLDAPTIITSLVLDPKIATQRRRLRG